jgi:hypothetical protein
VTDFSGYNADTDKECLKKVLLAYHPDKQGGANSSRKWQVLAEEITKVRFVGLCVVYMISCGRRCVLGPHMRCGQLNE